MTDELLERPANAAASLDDPLAAARWLASVGRELHQAPGLESTLQRIVDLAQSCTAADAALLIGADPHHTSARVLAATDHDLAAWLIALQPASTSGPGRESIRTGQTVRVDDLSLEARWPGYASEIATSTPIRSVLATALIPRGGPRTAGIVVYGYRAFAFDSLTEDLLRLFAEQASIAFDAATEADRSANLELALSSARDIGAAVGVLMERHQIDRSAAFKALVKASQDSNRKVRDIAGEVLGTPADAETANSGAP